MPEDLSFRIHDSNVDIWAETNGPAAEVMELVKFHLRLRGFDPRPDPECVKRYGDKFAADHLLGRRGDLRVALSLGGRHVEVTFFQDVVHKNSAGGRHDFDKLKLMPYLLRLATILELRKLSAVLAGAGWRDDTDRRSQLGMDGVRRHQADWRKHHGDAVDHPENRHRHDRTDADGKLLDNGMIRYSRDHKGHLIRGPVFYNMNNMWLLVSSPDEWPHNLSCRSLFTYDPAKHPRKQHRNPRRPIIARKSPVQGVRRSLVERYDINEGGGITAIFLDEHDGRLAINGNYGEHGYAWGHVGTASEFKRHLVGCNRSYLMEKLRDRQHDEFNADESKKCVGKAIAEALNERSITVDVARNARRDLKLADTDSAAFFARDLYESAALSEVLNGDLEGLIVNEPDPQLVGFFDRVWPKFIAALQAELAAEKPRKPNQLTDLELINRNLQKADRHRQLAASVRTENAVDAKAVGSC